MTLSENAGKTPFTILTGWLGAGKTTVLNRVLALGTRRLAVLVNDLGRVNIDRRLLASQSGDFLELSNGCVCCAVDVQRDLWTGIIDVVLRSRPEHVVLETTGIAEPQVILDGLAAREENQAHVFAAGVIAVVDAEAGRAQIERRAEVRAQIECADRIMLSKLDVAAPGELASLHARLAELNADAERAAFPATAAGDAALATWLCEARETARARKSGLSRPHRHGQLSVATFVDDHPLAGGPLLALLERLGDALMRAKGFVHLAGEERRGFVERAGVRTQLALGQAWAEGEPRRTELVLIGDGLDEQALRRALWACRAG